MGYLTMSVKNVYHDACIELSCIGTGEPPGDITKVKLKRRLQGTSSWIVIGEIPIAAVGDFTFKVRDYNTKSRYSYDYMAMPSKGDIETIGIISSIKCEFDGFFIGDDFGHYVCTLNPKVDSQPNGEAAVLTTLGSQYPFVIENSMADYESGTASGLFLPRVAGRDFSAEDAQTVGALMYKQEIVAWLKNRQKKVLKTFDGQVWYIRVKNRPSMQRSDFDGASEISFEWVEIGAPPATGVVVV